MADPHPRAIWKFGSAELIPFAYCTKRFKRLKTETHYCNDDDDDDDDDHDDDDKQKRERKR